MSEAYGILQVDPDMDSQDLIFKIHSHMLTNSSLYQEQFLGFVTATRLEVGDQILNHLVLMPLSVVTEEGLHEASEQNPISLQVFKTLKESVKVEDDGQVPLDQLTDTPPGLVESLKAVWVATTKKILDENPPFYFDLTYNLVLCNHLAHTVFADVIYAEMGYDYRQLNADWSNKIVRIRDVETGKAFANLCTSIYQTKLAEVNPEVTDPTHRQYLAIAETIKAA